MSTIKHTRGSMSLPIDGVRLEQAIRLRGYTKKYVAYMCGCTAANLSQIKRRGSITAEMRSKLRNVLGIREDEYLANEVRVATVPADCEPSRPEDCLLLRRDELKSIVKEAILDIFSAWKEEQQHDRHQPNPDCRPLSAVSGGRYIDE